MTSPVRTSTSPFAHNLTFQPLSQKKQETIHRLFEEMATSSMWQLMTSSLRLQNIGEQLRKDVHPFQMLMEIFADEKTHRHFQTIYERKTEILSGRHVVWSNFIQGVEENLKNRKDEIDPYLNTFAKAMKTHPLSVRSYLQNQDYNGLISSIVQNNPPNKQRD